MFILEQNFIIHYTVDGHFLACHTFLGPQLRHVLGHSRDSRGMACLTFVDMVYTLSSLSLLGSLRQKSHLLKRACRKTSFHPKKKLNSSKGASFCK
jgi:hypothetical protein